MAIKVDPYTESINQEADHFLTTQLTLAAEEEEPKDHFKMVYFIMLLQGAGVLLPWNAFISAPDYFSSLYGDSTLSYFGVANSVPNLLGLLLLIKFGSKLPLIARILPPFIVCLLVLITVPILAYCKVYGTVGFAVLLSLIVVTALATASVQGGIFGFAGTLPPHYIQAVMSGNGLAGIITSIIRVATKLTIERVKKGEKVPLSKMTLSASIYFLVSAAVIVLCVVTFVIMLRTPFVLHYQKKAKQSDSGKPKPSEEEVAILASDKSNGSQQEEVSILAVFGKIYHMCFYVGFVFFVTLAIFPGISVTIVTHYQKTFMEDWISIFMVVLFNVGDFVGRSAPRFIVLFKSERWLGIPILLRVIFLPLFILCIYPRVIIYDAFPLVFMFLMALTNGYLSSNAMMLAPGLVKPHEREVAGTMMTFFLLLGLCIGSNCGALIGKIVGL